MIFFKKIFFGIHPPHLFFLHAYKANFHTLSYWHTSCYQQLLCQGGKFSIAHTMPIWGTLLQQEPCQYSWHTICWQHSPCQDSNSKSRANIVGIPLAVSIDHANIPHDPHDPQSLAYHLLPAFPMPSLDDPMP